MNNVLQNTVSVTFKITNNSENSKKGIIPNGTYKSDFIRYKEKIVQSNNVQIRSDSTQSRYKLKYHELEKFFTVFLASLTREEATVLYKMLMKLFSLPRGVSMEQFQSGLIHDLESEDDLRKISYFDTFKWNIHNWKCLFTENND